MIPEAGLAALWLAAALSVLQMLCGALSVRARGAGGAVLTNLTRPAAVLQGALAAVAFAMLFLILLVRPQGLLGRASIQKV